jgi:hypothetical protein
MPRGTFHIETGLLLEQRGRLILQRDEGGTWRLSADPGAYKLVGRRVRLEGIRIGFDLLDVTRVAPC